jgi:hemoglobin
MQQEIIGLIHSSVGKADEPFYKLVDEFYAAVANDPVLRPLYPEDLTESKRHLALFLIQRCGGPTTYSDERGHPRMRGRHMPFKIGMAERDAWVKNMFAAIDKVDELQPFKEPLRQYFAEFASFMINQPG